MWVFAVAVEAEDEEEWLVFMPMYSHVSRQFWISLLKPWGQVLGSTLVQKSGWPELPQGRNTKHNKLTEAGHKC